MILVIQTQNSENYAWREDGTLGTGAEAYWKMKGGNEFIVDNIPADATYESLHDIVDMLRGDIEIINEGYRSEIVGYGLQEDGYMSWFEKSQLEYDGEITSPEPRIDYAEHLQALEFEYADWSADADAQAYGEMV